MRHGLPVTPFTHHSQSDNKSYLYLQGLLAGSSRVHGKKRPVGREEGLVKAQHSYERREGEVNLSLIAGRVGPSTEVAHEDYKGPAISLLSLTGVDATALMQL